MTEKIKSIQSQCPRR